MNKSTSYEQEERRIDFRKYQETRYLDRGRWASYREVICEVNRINPSKILEIGPGNGIVSCILKTLGFNIYTLDINSTIKPDIIGSVAELPIKSDSFDLIVAQQILEHLPFSRFPQIISDFSSIAKVAIISLPHVSFHFTFGVKLPLLKWHSVSVAAPFTIGRTSRDHHWEIGNDLKIKKIHYYFMKAGFEIERSFRTPEHPYHHFFILRKPIVDISESKLCE